MPCFLIKKNPGSTSNPWLGTVPKLTDKELFGKISVRHSEDGGNPKVFADQNKAFQHIRDVYPGDVGTMQVYELLENGERIQLKHVPWSV